MALPNAADEISGLNPTVGLFLEPTISRAWHMNAMRFIRADLYPQVLGYALPPALGGGPVQDTSPYLQRALDVLESYAWIDASTPSALLERHLQPDAPTLLLPDGLFVLKTPLYSRGRVRIQGASVGGTVLLWAPDAKGPASGSPDVMLIITDAPPKAPLSNVDFSAPELIGTFNPRGGLESLTLHAGQGARRAATLVRLETAHDGAYRLAQVDLVNPTDAAIDVIGGTRRIDAVGVQALDVGGAVVRFASTSATTSFPHVVNFDRLVWRTTATAGFSSEAEYASWLAATSSLLESSWKAAKPAGVPRFYGGALVETNAPRDLAVRVENATIDAQTVLRNDNRLISFALPRSHRVNVAMANVVGRVSPYDNVAVVRGDPFVSTDFAAVDIENMPAKVATPLALPLPDDATVAASLVVTDSFNGRSVSGPVFQPALALQGRIVSIEDFDAVRAQLEAQSPPYVIRRFRHGDIILNPKPVPGKLGWFIAAPGSDAWSPPLSAAVSKAILGARPNGFYAFLPKDANGQVASVKGVPYSIVDFLPGASTPDPVAGGIVLTFPSSTVAEAVLGEILTGDVLAVGLHTEEPPVFSSSIFVEYVARVAGGTRVVGRFVDDTLKATLTSAKVDKKDLSCDVSRSAPAYRTLDAV